MSGNVFIIHTCTPKELHWIHYILWKYEDSLCALFRHSCFWDYSCAVECLSLIHSTQLLWITSLETIREENLCHLTILAAQSLWLLQNWYVSLYCSPLIQNILITSVHCRISWFITLTASKLISLVLGHCSSSFSCSIHIPCSSSGPLCFMTKSQTLTARIKEKFWMNLLKEILDLNFNTYNSTGSKSWRLHWKSGIQNLI